MREAETAATDVPWRMKLALARHSISHRIHILDVIMGGYRSLLLHTLTPAKVVFLRRRVVHIITSGTTCVV